jgi:carboxyl-terminal processing protease
MFMNNNNNKWSILLPMIISLSFVTGLFVGPRLPGKHNQNSITSGRDRNDKLTNVLNIIEANYVDTVNTRELIETAIPAMLGKLDPHSLYIPARDLKRANEPLQGNFDGIGISFNMITDTILIINTIPGGPSEKIGLEAGDKILYVNDSLVAGRRISDQDVMGMLKGRRGTIVKVKVLRRGHKGLLEYSIVRDRIPIYSVDVAYMITGETGYIRINNFAMTTFDEFMTGLRELKGKGMRSLIVDLRGNSGGIMDAAIQIANQFLKENQLIVYTLGRMQPRNEARATGKGEFSEGKVVILIDEWSASASEILAGAIQDNDRGTIIGRRSFGKGLVQEPVSFSDGSGMRLTVARYYTPTGRSIQKPYNNNEGFDDYYEELGMRINNGEYLHPDSIYFADSLKFTTPGGKTVYGGGGIMPDRYVPYDTTGISDYFQMVRPHIYAFALSYTETKRETLKKFSTPADLEKYLDTQNLLSQFTEYAEKKSVKKNQEGITISGSVISIQLKAYIARNMLDNKGFYPIWEKLDSTLKYALDYIENKRN